MSLASRSLERVATPEVRRILAHLETLLDGGHIHILDLVLGVPLWNMVYFKRRASRGSP